MQFENDGTELPQFRRGPPVLTRAWIVDSVQQRRHGASFVPSLSCGSKRGLDCKF